MKVHIFLALLIVGTLTLPQTAAAAPLAWTAPVAIGADLPSSWFPDLYADRTGKVRVVWSSNLEAGDGNVTTPTPARSCSLSWTTGSGPRRLTWR